MSSFFIVALLLAGATNTLGDSSPSALFNKNYVNQTTSSRAAPLKPTIKPTALHEDPPASNPESVLKEGNSTTTPLPAPESILLDEEGVNVHSLGLVVNGRNVEHFYRHLETLIDTASRFELLVSQVAAIGLIIPGKESLNMSDFMFTPHAFSLVALEGQIAPYTGLPTRLEKVTRSPTWVVNTERGAVLVEGYEPIWKLFNRDGQFLGLSERLTGLLERLAENEERLEIHTAKKAIEVSTPLFQADTAATETHRTSTKREEHDPLFQGLEVREVLPRSKPLPR